MMTNTKDNAPLEADVTSQFVEPDRLVVSCDLKVQAAKYESVGAFRSYSASVTDGVDIDTLETALIDRAIGVTAMVVDTQLVLNYEQQPRFRGTWHKWAYLLPDRFKPVMGVE